MNAYNLIIIQVVREGRFIVSVHIFQISEENYRISTKKGLVGLPEPKAGGRNANSVFDGLLSRLAVIRENDYILMYVTGVQELRGVWQADGEPFYEESPVWLDKTYPFRCKIKCSEYNFENPLKLNDINDLINSGKIWTWALQRASGSNSMFSISNAEFEIILEEFMKLNPFSQHKRIIPEPYPFRENHVSKSIHLENQKPKYEYSVMTLLNDAFSHNKFTELFGNYTDYLSYVPTSLGKEMDIVLMFGNKNQPEKVLSYDLIEVKRDLFDEKALEQLVGYESWFLQKKVSGYMKMLRTTAIAKRFSEEVVNYVSQRTRIENKRIKLIQYDYSVKDDISLKLIN